MKRLYSVFRFLAACSLLWAQDPVYWRRAATRPRTRAIHSSNGSTRPKTPSRNFNPGDVLTHSPICLR